MEASQLGLLAIVVALLGVRGVIGGGDGYNLLIIHPIYAGSHEGKLSVFSYRIYGTMILTLDLSENTLP